MDGSAMPFNLWWPTGNTSLCCGNTDFISIALISIALITTKIYTRLQQQQANKIADQISFFALGECDRMRRGTVFNDSEILNHRYAHKQR
jgi:hypothetical protein